MAEVEQLAARCRAVGWRVERSKASAGYRVYPPGHAPVPLHMSPSDRNAIKNAEKYLTERGLAEAEERAAAERNRIKREQMLQARQEADRAAKQMARRGAMVQAAAGPYAKPEHVDYQWFADEHPAPWRRPVIMSPDLAARLLEHHNTCNRPMAAAQVERYRQIIASGQWRWTHQGMAMDRNRVLQDGQHRLAAIAESDMELPVDFTVGVDPDNFKALDEGKLRRVADLLARDGQSYTAQIQAMLRLVGAYESPDRRDAHRRYQSNASLYDRFNADGERLTASARWSATNYRRARLNASALGASHYLISRTNGDDNPFVSAFFRGLATGLKGDTRLALDEDDPRTRLRCYMQRKRETRARTTGADQLGLVIMTWNHVVTDHRVHNLRWHRNQEIPDVVVCRATGPNASSAPSCLQGEVAAVDGNEG